VALSLFNLARVHQLADKHDLALACSRKSTAAVLAHAATGDIGSEMSGRAGGLIEQRAYYFVLHIANLAGRRAKNFIPRPIWAGMGLRLRNGRSTLRQERPCSKNRSGRGSPNFSTSISRQRGFWSEVQQVYEKRIWTSLPSSLRIAWNGVWKPRHFVGVRLAVMAMSWISSSDSRSMSM
jgi:hypothetical protein